MKRKAAVLDGKTTGIQDKPVKRRRNSPKAKGKSKEAVAWPPYFDELFQIFKAINTVLGFVGSRKHLAVTFSVVRSSVETLLKRPLELAKVAELKALLPDIVRFSYIPQSDLRIHADSASSNRRRESSPDFSCTASSRMKKPDAEQVEHVLILEFADSSRPRKGSCSGLTMPSSLSPSAAKKLIEKRNERCCQAVDEFLQSISPEDPVSVLQKAGLAHAPVNPSEISESTVAGTGGPLMIPEPEDRPPMKTILMELEKQAWYKDQIVSRRVFEARQGRIATLDAGLSDSIANALMKSRKISNLYTHQVAAIDTVNQRKHVVVSTSTASGKSVIYQIPTLRFLEESNEATAMFIYPTKALAQDQKTALEQLVSSCSGLEHLKVATYDGDTCTENRAGIRMMASVIFTNFDMIHASILPHEHLWRRFLKNLKLLVVDELHYYSGLLGRFSVNKSDYSVFVANLTSHVAQVMRRLRRVCAAVGNRRIRFVACSATISNPVDHMKSIFGLDSSEVEAITEDGAPAGSKEFLLWNPSFIDPKVPSLGRHSALSDATNLMRFLMKHGIRVILFCKIRKICELAMKAIRAELCDEGRYDILERTMPYRGGYSPEERRRIEREAFSGHLLGIIATNALELGVDIGTLDAVIMLGFPGSISSFRQQMGRAGRQSRDSLAIFIANRFPVDQQYVQHPDALFETSGDDVVIDLESKMLLEAHLQCAAHEMPLSMDDTKYFGPLLKELCEKHLVKDSEGWYHTHPRLLPCPSQNISIRVAQEEKYAVVDITKDQPGTIIEEIETSRAMFEVYEGGVFLHRGSTFIVQEVSHDSKIAKVIQSDVNWITSPRDFANVDATHTYRIKEVRTSSQRVYYGKVELEVKVFGFFKIRNNCILDAVDLETPTWEQDTTGLWIDVPKTILDLFRTKGINAAEAIHAAQHAILNCFTMGQDLKTECKVAQKEYRIAESKRKRPARLIFCDNIGKGGGIAAKAFDNVNELLKKAFYAIESCDCQEGCTRCVQSPRCKEGNLVSSKAGAHLILKAILGLIIDPDCVAAQGGTEVAETVVEAGAVPALDGIQVESDSA